MAHSVEVRPLVGFTSPIEKWALNSSPGSAQIAGSAGAVPSIPALLVREIKKLDRVTSNPSFLWIYLNLWEWNSLLFSEDKDISKGMEIIPQRGVALVLASLPDSAKEFGETYPFLSSSSPSHPRDPCDSDHWPTGLSLFAQLPEISALTLLPILSLDTPESQFWNLAGSHRSIYNIRTLGPHPQTIEWKSWRRLRHLHF